ncbi:MAG: hypothetical protein KGY81_04140 [Phycisphaerae bacterium]|jgi:hypothetical protein|nr:hypothetical protein [Phycisphaerae bacterium]
MKTSLPIRSLSASSASGEAPDAPRPLDGYVCDVQPRRQVHVRRRAIPLAGRLMQMAIRRYEDHAHVR